MTARTCGTCGNGQRTPYPNEVECKLGWSAHDPELGKAYDRKTKKTTPYVLGHPGVPLPILTADHRCAVRQNNQGWRAA